MTATADRGQILKGALLAGGINAIINGTIQSTMLRGTGPVALSVDSIGAGTHTVLSTAVPLAVSLAMILTVVAYLTLKAPKRPFWPGVPWLIVSPLARWSRRRWSGSVWQGRWRSTPRRR
jgi:hypothetical protein